MLAADMLKGTGRTIPKDHPEHSKFSPLRPFVSHKFDLVLLDGIVLRTHERATYRQELEPLRLSTAQLVLGMQRVIQGGTIVMLMHKVDTWASVAVIYGKRFRCSHLISLPFIPLWCEALLRDYHRSLQPLCKYSTLQTYAATRHPIFLLPRCPIHRRQEPFRCCRY
jgi:hypothetical protein